MSENAHSRDNYPGRGTRLIAMGSAALTEGFSLIGFETWPDASEEDLEEVLNEIMSQKQKALVFLEPHLAKCDCSSLRKVQMEGGNILVTEIPSLHTPGDYRPQVEDLVVSVLGASALKSLT